MKLLLLGGTHFIGRTIAAKLSEAHAVTVLNRGSAAPPTGVAHQVLDRQDQRAMDRLSSEEWDVIVDVSATEPSLMTPLLSGLAAVGARPRYVLLSSAAVYERANCVPPFSEDCPAGGDSIWGPYGVAKAECERALLDSPLGPDAVVLRPPYVYGPANNEDRESWLWARILNDAPVYVPGNGETRIQFVHIDDLAEVVRAAAEGTLTAGVFNVGSRQAVTFTEYLQLLGEAAGSPVKSQQVNESDIPAREYFPFRQADLVLDVNRLGDALPMPDRELASGLTTTLAWFRAHAPERLGYVPNAREQAWQG